MVRVTYGAPRHKKKVRFFKQARGFRQFLLRGVENVRAEWAIVCTVHNLLKLAGALKLAKTA